MPEMQSDDDLLSTIEVAEKLNVERQTVNRWVRQDKLKPAHKMPGNTGAHLFRRGDVERFKATRVAGVQA